MLKAHRKLFLIAMTALACAASTVSVADNLYTYKTRPRNVDDAVGIMKLYGAVPTTGLFPTQSSGGLGKRIGKTSFPGDRLFVSKYVRAPECVAISTVGHGDGHVSGVSPVTDYGDGSKLWNIVADNTHMEAACYFDGPSGVFSLGTAYDNYNNETSSVSTQSYGYYVRSVTNIIRLNPVTGVNETSTSYGDFAYAPCSVAPGSAECAAITPPSTPQSCAALGIDYGYYPYNLSGVYVGNSGGQCVYVAPAPPGDN